MNFRLNVNFQSRQLIFEYKIENQRREIDAAYIRAVSAIARLSAFQIYSIRVIHVEDNAIFDASSHAGGEYYAILRNL